MEKKYNLPEKSSDQDRLEEPVTEYCRILKSNNTAAVYEIPEVYLLERIDIAEKEILEGKGMPFEEVMKRFQIMSVRKI